ncbi:MAG TPA: energy transducer TonB [Pyrinomonadaceae bacterium]|jgi:TonB family protein|nr:energy transducer TonB [Pyrinomonadaceae bacterium]
MKKSLLLSLLILLTCASAAKTTQDAAGRYSKDGLSFDYPAGWTLADKSGDAAQQLVLFLQGSSARVQVVAHRQPLQSREQVSAARESITIPYVKGLARQFGLGEAPDWKDAQCLTVGKRLATGLHFSGRLDGEPGAADVFTVVLGQRLVHLVYTRADKDDARGSEAWKGVTGSLSVEPPQNPSPAGAQLDAQDAVWGGILTGKARKMPPPELSASAKLSGTRGSVVVEVFVDERGDVLSARSLAGHPTLRPAAEAAARRAKFTPTIFCGSPVKVTGTITYNFM